MDLFPEGMPVRLRSRACDLFLFADEDGVGVSLSTLRASPRASWEVRRVERHGVGYVLLHNTADGRHLDITPDPAPPGARGLRVVQGETLGVEWSVRLAGDGSRDVLVRHSVHGFLCPMGCGTGVGVRQRVNGRSSLLPRWSVEPAPVAPLPPVTPPSKAMEEALGSVDLMLRGARRGGKIWAPVLGVTSASRGPFWIPLLNSRLRQAGYTAHQAVVGLPHVDIARGGEPVGGGMIIVMPAADVARLPTPARVWQKLRRHVGPGQRLSRAAVFLPLCRGPAAGGNEPEPEPEPEAPVMTCAVQAMMRQLEKLHQGMEARVRNIRDHVRRLRDIELMARTGNYDSKIPLRKAVEEIEEPAVDIVESYNIMKEEADDLSAAIEREGVTVPAPPEVLRARLEESLTRSIRRRLLRRQFMKEGKDKKAF